MIKFEYLCWPAGVDLNDFDLRWAGRNDMIFATEGNADRFVRTLQMFGKLSALDTPYPNAVVGSACCEQIAVGREDSAADVAITVVPLRP